MEIRKEQPDRDYRDLLGRLSPTDNFAHHHPDSWSVIVVAMPDDRYSVHLGNKTLYFDLATMPDNLRSNLLLIKARYGSDMVDKTYAKVSYDEFRDVLSGMIVDRNSYMPHEFRQIGSMPYPGVYCVTVKADQVEKMSEGMTNG